MQMFVYIYESKDKDILKVKSSWDIKPKLQTEMIYNSKTFYYTGKSTIE